MARIFKGLSILLIVCFIFTVTAIPARAKTVFDCSTVTDVGQDECEALVSLYNSTNGSAWTDNTNWLTGTTVGNWYGVTVSSGQVYWISMYNNNLTGPLPREIGNLNGLDNLYLQHNNLSGSIPVEIADISTLRYLTLSENQLSGPIPAALFNMTMVDFRVMTNNFTGSLPSTMGDAANLTTFIASNNNLTGPLPESIGDLVNLNLLWIEHNDLYGPIPTDMKKCELIYSSILVPMDSGRQIARYNLT